VRVGTLRLEKGSHLLLDDDLLERLEHGFALGEGKTQHGGGEVFLLHAGRLPCLRLALVGCDHDLDGILHGWLLPVTPPIATGY
jgi:hypothetical protein